MERIPERFTGGPFLEEAGKEKPQKLNVNVSRGLDDVINPEEGRFPYEYAVKQLAALAHLDIGKLDSYEELYRTKGMSQGYDQFLSDIYKKFRYMGFTRGQMGELVKAARLDVQEQREDWDSNRLRTLGAMYLQERTHVDRLLGSGKVQTQVNACANAVIDYVLLKKLTSTIRSTFDVRFHGPVGGFLFVSDEYHISNPSFMRMVGCFNIYTDVVHVLLSEEALEIGELQPDDLSTVTHEMVHATAPAVVEKKPGTGKVSRERAGLSSIASASTRRSRGVTLTGLNEGVTESLARSISMTRKDFGISTTRTYEGFVQDIVTLCQMLHMDRDELYRLYYSVHGTLQLGRRIAETTPLGIHGLALFDIFSLAQEEGFTIFVDTYMKYMAGMEFEPLVVPFSIVERPPKTDGTPQAIYPPLTAEYLEKTYPFVRVE